MTTPPAHRLAWQETFDAFLDEIGSDAARFIEADYLTYVDGKPRYDGVRDFLESRDIVLPDGTSDDSPEAMTVCGLGNRKNERFLQILAGGGGRRASRLWISSSRCGPTRFRVWSLGGPVAAVV